jgi:hypothetical protein
MSIAALTSTGASSSTLVKLGNGEYTAASVDNDQKDALKLGLVKEKDGNYGTTSSVPTGSAGSAQRSSTVLTSLTSLKIGGS